MVEDRARAQNTSSSVRGSSYHGHAWQSNAKTYERMCKVDCTFTHCTTWFIVQDTRQSCNVEIHVFRCFQQGASITEQSSSPVEVCGGFQACQMVMIAHLPRTCWGPRSRPRSLSHIAYTPMAWLLAACHIAHVSVKHSVSGNCHHSSLHHPSLRRPSCIHSTSFLPQTSSAVV